MRVYDQCISWWCRITQRRRGPISDCSTDAFYSEQDASQATDVEEVSQPIAREADVSGDAQDVNSNSNSQFIIANSTASLDNSIVVANCDIIPDNNDTNPLLENNNDTQNHITEREKSQIREGPVERVIGTANETELSNESEYCNNRNASPTAFEEMSPPELHLHIQLCNGAPESIFDEKILQQENEDNCDDDDEVRMKMLPFPSSYN